MNLIPTAAYFAGSALYGATVIASPTPTTGNPYLDFVGEIGAFAVAVAVGYYFLTRSDRREKQQETEAQIRERIMREERDAIQRKYEALIDRMIAERERRRNGMGDG